ncbi:MAG: PDZ domain-containing protein [Pirellulaceae bacterium]|nr:PDZ domain-containing protein [Pirellulaceae bacterium]
MRCCLIMNLCRPLTKIALAATWLLSISLACETQVQAQTQTEALSDRPGAASTLPVNSTAGAIANTDTDTVKDAETVTETDTSAFQNSVTEPSLEKLEQQIKNLSNPSYRTRQLAIWYLEQNPRRALPLLRKAGQTTDLNIGAEIIAMLSSQAMMPDTDISVEAHEALREIAGGTQSVTAVSQLAIGALEGIADRQELLATQALEDLNVELGELRLTIGGIMQNEMGTNNNFIVHVTEDFRGRDVDMRLFRFLRSYESAYLEGPAVNEKMLREVLAMPSLKRLVLKGDAIQNELLGTLFEARELEHLELVYAAVDDKAVDTIVDLPLVGSLRVFGTKISFDGAARIKQALDGLDIYFGRGGFLGVKTSPSDLRVSQVVDNSGAQLGGIQAQDVITHINDKPIKIFAQLREELANFAPGDKVTVVVERTTFAAPPRRETEPIKLSITLGVQETQAN